MCLFVEFAACWPSLATVLHSEIPKKAGFDSCVINITEYFSTTWQISMPSQDLSTDTIFSAFSTAGQNSMITCHLQVSGFYTYHVFAAVQPGNVLWSTLPELHCRVFSPRLIELRAVCCTVPPDVGLQPHTSTSTSTLPRTSAKKQNNFSPAL